jgi:signal transduction histidine kinase
LFLAAVSLLGLTAYRISFTRSKLHTYESIVAAILTTAILATIWAPIAFFTLFRNRVADTYTRSRFSKEIGVNAALWLMYLVVSVYYTNRMIPGKNFCPVGKTCDILVAILALSWTGWSILSLILVFTLMHHAAANTTTKTSLNDTRGRAPAY